jgi:hypothetical protein
MPIQCPTCSRVNPANASYCYYDGRGLHEAALNGPLGLGTRPFPLPFSFSDGHGCSNYNQLVLACDRRWNEARTYLVNGTWKSFFGAIGRADLAILAALSANQGDPDIGLCHLLERLPADAEALRPPKLALTSNVEDLGTLEPGKDYKLDVVIENQGMLVLRGSIVTECDWLAFGDHQGSTSTKLFQTRDTYGLSVRVVGSKLRAGKKPLEGQIVIDTNGGLQTVTVRATVPVRPFPRGQAGNDVLAGSASPREIAVRAKKHPRAAAVLFEQGAVKAWYESNGWTYPIRGTQAKGKCALQQFFEALGLTTPPHLEISTERIVCQGEVGKRLMKKVIVRTSESKFVHAEAHSNQDWVKVLSAIPQGNSTTLPLRIEIPPRPGETLDATVTFLGNGQQRFVVPVTLTVAAKPAEEEEKTINRGQWLQWMLAGGVVFLGLVIALVVVIKHHRSLGEKPPVEPEVSSVPEEPRELTVEHWWDGFPGTNLTASVAVLKRTAGENRPIFERIEGKSEISRRDGYEQLAAKLPELGRDPLIRQPLGSFVTECCVYERSELNITPLLRGLAHQFPAEDSPFPPEDKGEEIARASFWLGVVCDTIANKAAPPDRSRSLAGEVDKVFGFALDPGVSADEFKARAEKALAEQCYHNLLPTAEKSIEQALTIREVLLTTFPNRLEPAFRDQEDVKLLAIGLARNNDLWPKLEPMFKTCLQSNAIDIDFKLIDFYEKANADLAAKMEGLLAARWKAAGNPRLTQAARAAAIRKSMAAARIPYAERVKRLQELLASSPLSAARPDRKPPPNPLQTTVRLAHTSTMACILFGKDSDKERFDELIGHIPGIEQDRMVEGRKSEEQPRQPGEKEVIDLGAGSRVIEEQLTDKSDLDPRRDTYRKEYSIRLKAGEIYVLDMRSNELTPYLRVETLAGNRLVYDRGANTHITYTPPMDGVYRLVASSWDKKATGHFTLHIARQQIIRFGFPRVPPPVVGNTGEQKAPPLNLSDLADLGHKQSKVRMAAFKNLARGLPKDLPYRHAQKIAAYLLLTEPEAASAEIEAVVSQLPSVAKCRSLLEALADVIANGDKLAQRRTEAVVGGLLEQKLRFALGEDWRSACRKLLLQRALELSGRTSHEADRAADFLRDLYKEQGLALGLEAPDFQQQTQFTAVLERLIKHVAATAAQQKLAPADRTYLEQIGRQLQAARFAVENDLEYAVLLQRIWIKVLILALQERASEQARKTMKTVQQGLDENDREASNLLDQLRSGEENILRVWAIAHDLKLP